MVADAMVLIHLAKTTVLERACEHFAPVLAPPAVRDEVLAGKRRGHTDATLVEGLVKEGAIQVREVTDATLRARAGQLNLQGGEAEAVALCWQEGVRRLATDDDNVRRKRLILGLDVVGTPAMLLALYKAGRIDRAKLSAALDELERIGWFGQPVLDKVRLEVERWERR